MVALRIIAALAFLGAAGLLLGTASAHAFLDHASPSVGSEVPKPPPAVRLWFSQELEPAFSTITVTDAAGRRVDNGDAAIDPKDPSALSVTLRNLPPGTYSVRWRVVSVDTHPTEGSFTFTIGGQ